jgi:uncharacterized protein (TIGR03086 family)
MMATPTTVVEEGYPMSETIKRFEQASERFAALVHDIAPDAWSNETPCEEWNVRALVNHVVAELLWAPPLLDGQTIEEVGDRFDGDVLGDDPAATTDAAGASARRSFSADGAPERIVHLSFGDFTGDNYCWQLISDLVVHTWDLSRGIGADDAMDQTIAEEVYDFVAPMLGQMSGSPYFKPPVSVGDDASPQEVLLAASGRKP